ncbi:MaoC/PaaZ C-terminal domain-containing protein, partial [Streptomyces carpinensis]
LPLLGLVHTSIGITRHTALPATETYELAVHIDGLAAHRRGTEAAVITELRAGGDLVWESTSTYLARHRTPGGAVPAGTGAPGPERRPLPAVDRWYLGADLGRRYGAASGDRNPIHLYPLTARLFGFPRAIAHGMWTAARCLAAHGTPEAVRVRAEFKAPVPLPGRIVYAADGGGRFELRAAEGVRTHLVGEVLPLLT